MKKKLIIIICLIITIASGAIYTVLALEWGSNGTGGNVTFEACGSQYNGCIGVDSYRYTIIKDVDIKSNGITYNVVPGTISYEQKVRSDENGNYTSLYGDYGIINSIKTGGYLFKKVIQNTNVNMQEFFSNNYYIMIEVKHIIYYDLDSNAPYNNSNTESNYTSDMANLLLNSYNGYDNYIWFKGMYKSNGLRSATKFLPCYAYIPVGGSWQDNYCIWEGNSDYIKTYLEIAKSNNRFGKYLIYANDITKPKGSLTINKTTRGDDALKDLGGTGPFFRLFNDSNCTIDNIEGHDSFSSGVEIGNLEPGTYYIKEIYVKKGYHQPEPGDDNYCVPVTITPGGNTIVPIENKTECEYRFRSDISMKERIDLYNDIEDWYELKFNALLNMGNTTSSDACKNVEVKKNYKTSCLGATTSSTGSYSFNENNLSMFTEKHGSYTFCLTTFNMENKYGTSNFGTIKSGRPIIRTDNVVAKGTLNRVCYNYGDTTTTIIPLSYSNYITQEPILGDQFLIEGDEIDSGGLLNQTITKDYTLPKMYSHNKDGKVYYNSCPYGNQCKDLGYGIISKFNEEPRKKKLNFNIKLNEDRFGELNSFTFCNYTIENELIDNRNNINLEFRTVKTGIDNSFFSKTGSGTRKIGANWVGNENILKENNDSYNKNNETEPKYSITLTPSIIDDIRSYNKSNKYDNYDFDCKNNGTICISNYLSKLKNEYGLEINTTNRTNYENIR